MQKVKISLSVGVATLIATCFPSSLTAQSKGIGPNTAKSWKIGTPIVTYYAGPTMTDGVAKQMADGGWNVVWCNEAQLNIVHHHGLRAMLHDELLKPETIDDPTKRAKLDGLIHRVRNHPAMYQYYIIDEPGVSAFAGLGKLTAYLRLRDPAHSAYINLFPTYASNEQLGTKGDTVTAYREYLRQFVNLVNPQIISYDHYHFQIGGKDGDQYFLNLGMIRRCAMDAGVPFLNIVQACTWDPAHMRVPSGNEMRWLAFTSLAYGAQGLSYYVYSATNHIGGMVQPDGRPTAIYQAVCPINRDFAAIAGELQPLRSLGAYHVGPVPLGADGLPAKAPFRVDATANVLLGYFGKNGKPTHVVVVNLDYKKPLKTQLIGPGKMEIFQPERKSWSPAGRSTAKLHLPPGGGTLVRTR
ncbi:MAG: hypothetical protein WC975_16790 [Phycisphaerae bacterium]